MRFAAVKTVEDLKKFKIGVGQGWLDVEILRADGFTVVTGSNYEGLFEMLANGRSDALVAGDGGAPGEEYAAAERRFRGWRSSRRLFCIIRSRCISGFRRMRRSVLAGRCARGDDGDDRGWDV